MAAVVGSERAAMERFGSGGAALLPWTKQMLTVLWEQLRLLLQVIYYTFVSVFQMFRFEVHVRISDETGQRIQHMTTAANQTDSFLFSSLFDGDSGVMVGGANPLSDFCADVGDPFAGKSGAEALLSTLRADDLCCGMVDVSANEDAVFLGRQSGWKMGFPGDWNIFVSSADGSGSSDGCRRAGERPFSQDASEEERSFHWSSEDDQNVVEFDSEESKALWESLSKSSDPYNPFFFSACLSTNERTGRNKGKGTRGDPDLVSAGEEEEEEEEEAAAPRGLSVWVSRSDSESSWSSWASSEGSSPGVDEESERLLEFFSSPDDPYNPMCFTACTFNSTPPRTAAAAAPKPRASPPAPPSKSDSEEKEGSSPPSSDEEEEALWECLGQKDDPYHPLNFRARLQSSPASAPPPLGDELESVDVREPQKARAAKPTLTERKLKRHAHPEKTAVPWKRAERSQQAPTPEKSRGQSGGARKKVHFSPEVQVHVMRTWPFARQASRKGHWEEMARDRDRFRRRVREAEQTIGRCLSRDHRERVRASLDAAPR
ncbi:protein phosphatase 1 regulatory subunit 15B [Pungitius pungitius]|uniref:protein phosphatase 1 regulatory subunit 15B n=1 Tax=Pungitius pungitius TaxID=134920 RepID=UPI002E148906